MGKKTASKQKIEQKKKEQRKRQILAVVFAVLFIAAVIALFMWRLAAIEKAEAEAAANAEQLIQAELQKNRICRRRAYCPEKRNANLSGEFNDKLTVGIAWRVDKYAASDVERSLKQLGIKCVYLKEVKYNDWKYKKHKIPASYQTKSGYLKEEYADLIKDHGFRNSNAAEVMEGIDAVIFSGGEDISPSLYAAPDYTDANSSLNFYNASRDVADYLLMDYCLSNDVPVLGICRGMQLLGVVSGTSMIKDIPKYSKANGNIITEKHRPAKQPGSAKMYSSHNVYPLGDDSIFASIIDRDILEKVPSKHHQAVLDIAGTKLAATGYSKPDGSEIIEVIERRDKKFAVGVLFHPEIAVMRHLNKSYDRKNFMSKDDGLIFFKALCNSANLTYHIREPR